MKTDNGKKNSLRSMIEKAGLQCSLGTAAGGHKEYMDLPERMELLLKMIRRPMGALKGEILCMAMYDIEDDRVRNLMAKYLLRQGFIRIQKSVYVGRLARKRFREIQADLAEVNSIYENADSIILLPLHGESLAEGRIIGKEVNLTMLLDPPSVVII